MSEFNPDAELTLEIDADGSGSVANNLTTTVEGYVLDARQGKVLDDKKLDKANVANNLTTTQEGYALDARQGRQLEQTKIGLNQIANDLSTNDSNKVLSAAQGKVLGDKIVELENALDNLPETPEIPDVTLESLGAAKKPVVKIATLKASGWVDYVQTVTVSGVPADTDGNAVVVAAAPYNHDAYNECRIRCTAQAANSLTFKCGEVPTEDLAVNVAILS